VQKQPAGHQVLRRSLPTYSSQATESSAVTGVAACHPPSALSRRLFLLRCSCSRAVGVEPADKIGSSATALMARLADFRRTGKHATFSADGSLPINSPMMPSFPRAAPPSNGNPNSCNVASSSVFKLPSLALRLGASLIIHARLGQRKSPGARTQFPTFRDFLVEISCDWPMHLKKQGGDPFFPRHLKGQTAPPPPFLRHRTQLVWRTAQVGAVKESQRRETEAEEPRGFARVAVIGSDAGHLLER